MADGKDSQIELRTHQLLLAYADGLTVAEIAARFGFSNPSSVSSILSKHPDEYKAAKLESSAKRIAKYRRAGALAIDLQLRYLEELSLEDDTDLIRKEISKIAAIGEAAERRADLGEGKPTERTDHLQPQIVMFNPSAVAFSNEATEPEGGAV